MRTGHLRRNVQMEMDRQRIEARVGTNVVYGRYLEFGTSKMAARPWLSRGFRETAAEIRRILTTPIGSPI
jgi:HK97 gp10 family phage protein